MKVLTEMENFALDKILHNTVNIPAIIYNLI